jgi:N-acetylglutamate synthase-like GNAT family acetyltransferase
MAIIRPAQPHEADQITALALRSKAVWGYSQVFMDACRHELTISPDMIARDTVMVLETAHRIAGFYTLCQIDGHSAEIMHLFVDPELMNRGYGAQLWRHAFATAQSAGMRRLQVESDPFAESFYQRMGMIRYGQHASAIFEGRYLPLLELLW